MKINNFIGNIALVCSWRGIKKLHINDNEKLCNEDVYDVDFQNNNIEVVTMQSFMKTYVYVVRLDLRNNPIVEFNYNSFRPMKLLRFLYVPYVKEIVDETAIEQLMAFNTYLMFVTCSTPISVQFYAWNADCKNSTAEFFYNSTRLMDSLPTRAPPINLITSITKLNEWSDSKWPLFIIIGFLFIFICIIMFL